jgi:hypothetical protein
MEYLVNRLLERSAVKVARSVLRGGRWSNPPALPDTHRITAYESLTVWLS